MGLFGQVSYGLLRLLRQEWEGENFALCFWVPDILNSGYCYLHLLPHLCHFARLPSNTARSSHVPKAEKTARVCASVPVYEGQTAVQWRSRFYTRSPFYTRNCIKWPYLFYRIKKKRLFTITKTLFLTTEI